MKTRESHNGVETENKRHQRTVFPARFFEAKKIIRTIGGVLGLSVFVGLAASMLGWYGFRAGNVQAGTWWLSAASPFTWVVSRLTLRHISFVEVWHEGVWMGREAGKLALHTKEDPNSGALAAPEQLQLVWGALPRFSPHLQHFLYHFQRSWLLSKILPDSILPRASLEKSRRFLEALTVLQETDGRFLVIFQNTDELRATGGFMGSYAVLDLESQHPFEFTVRDIYDPSGVSMTLPSPPGQREYLSGGQGMRLTDANWSPDFPMSAAVILEYFESIENDPQVYDGVIAIPLSAVEDVVAAAGGVYMADAEKHVRAEELAEVARQDRQAFFPGSQEKTQFLQSFYRALLVTLADFSSAQWQSFASALLHRLPFEDIQLYAVDPLVQARFAAVNMAGALPSYANNQVMIIPVESNVGINKANRGVTRNMTLVLSADTLTLTTDFRNAYAIADRPSLRPDNMFYNTAPHLAYVNYYRILVPSHLTLRSLLVDGQPRTSWDEEVLVSSADQPFRQIGFLVVVPESGSAVIQIEWDLPAPVSQGMVWRQVGVTYGHVRLQCGTSAPLLLSLSDRLYQGNCENHIQ